MSLPKRVLKILEAYLRTQKRYSGWSGRSASYSQENTEDAEEREAAQQKKRHFNHDSKHNSNNTGTGTGHFDDTRTGTRDFDGTGTYTNDSFKDNTTTSSANSVPKDIEEALALFDLTYPTTLAIVTKKRNALLKTYHPDRFERHSNKKHIANDMIQLINNAYERLRNYLRH